MREYGRCESAVFLLYTPATFFRCPTQSLDIRKHLSVAHTKPKILRQGEKRNVTYQVTFPILFIRGSSSMFSKNKLKSPIVIADIAL